LITAVLQAVYLYLTGFADVLLTACVYLVVLLGPPLIAGGLVVWLFARWFLTEEADKPLTPVLKRVGAGLKLAWLLVKPIMVANVWSLAAYWVVQEEVLQRKLSQAPAPLAVLAAATGYAAGLGLSAWLNSRPKAERPAEGTAGGKGKAFLRGCALGLMLFAVAWIAQIVTLTTMTRLTKLDYSTLIQHVGDSRGFYLLAGTVQTRGELLVACLVLGLVVVWAEELYWRVFLLGKVPASWPRWPVALCCGLAYGMMHTSGLHIVPATLCGFVLSYVYLHHKSYPEVVGAHLVYAVLSLMAVSVYSGLPL